jgi:hypothetical protein
VRILARLTLVRASHTLVVQKELAMWALVDSEQMQEFLKAAAEMGISSVAPAAGVPSNRWRNAPIAHGYTETRETDSASGLRNLGFRYLDSLK